MSEATQKDAEEEEAPLSEEDLVWEETADAVRCIEHAHHDAYARYFAFEDPPTNEETYKHDLWEAMQLLARYVPRRVLGRADTSFILHALYHYSCLASGKGWRPSKEDDSILALKILGYPHYDNAPYTVANAAATKVRDEGMWVPEHERPGADVAELVTSLGALQKTTEIGPPERVGQYLTFRASLSLLSGPPKVGGKSTIAASEAVGITRAKKKVLWIKGSGEETRRDTVTRFVYLGADPELLVINTRPVTSWQQYRRLINTVRPSAVYVDSMASFLNGLGVELPPASDNIGWHKLMSKFRTGVATCVLAHASSKRGGEGDVLGSTGILQAVDFIISTHRVKGDASRTLRRLAYLGRHRFPARTIRFLGEREGFEDVADAPRSTEQEPSSGDRPLSDEDARVLAALVDGMLYGQWFAAAYPTRTKKEKSAFNNALARLLKHHVKKDEATGAYSRSKAPSSDESHDEGS